MLLCSGKAGDQYPGDTTGGSTESGYDVQAPLAAVSFLPRTDPRAHVVLWWGSRVEESEWGV
jgi:hypothetical protein